MLQFLYTVWNPNVEMMRIFGFPVRYYSLMWVIGLVAAYFLVRRFYRDRKISDEKFEPLFLYCFLGILIGARLGHCIFYEPSYYFASFRNFIEMLLPVRFMPLSTVSTFVHLFSRSNSPFFSRSIMLALSACL